MIPKKLHFLWLPSIEQAPVDQRGNPDKWAELNPDYSVHVWEHDEIRQLVSDKYRSFLDIWDSLEKPVKKADLSRLFIIHNEGGCYFDMDLIPLSPLKSFFEDPWIYNQYHKFQPVLPDYPSKDKINKNEFRCFLTREYQPIDNTGVGIANGVILCEKGMDWILEFLEQQKYCYKGLVLDYVGTWALTRFIRSRVDKLKSVKVKTLPPHYFLWEKRFFKCDPPNYTVCLHPAKNSWGDHSRSDWFRV